MKYNQCIREDNQVSFQDNILAIKKAGFDGGFIEWCNKPHDFPQEEQLKLCREIGLDVPFVHLGYNGINKIWQYGPEGEVVTNGYIRDLDILAQNGIDMAVMHLTAHSVAPPPSMIGIYRLRKLVKHAEELGIKIAFENTKIEGVLDYVLDNIPYANAGVCYDSGHDHCHFGDKFPWDKAKDRIFAVHLHDNRGLMDEHLLPFDGTIDWRRLAINLSDANYHGPITLESSYNGRYLDMDIVEFNRKGLDRAKRFCSIIDNPYGEMSK